MTKSNRVLSVALALATILWLPGTSAQEESESLSFEFSLDNASKYVWRGIEVNDEQVLQPSATIGYGGLSLNVWANYDMTDAGLRGDDQISEVDYTLAYSHEFEKVAVDAGVIAYVFPGAQGANTNEVFVGFSLIDTLLNPSLTVFYDFTEADGFYATFGIGHSYALTDDGNLTLDLGASIGAGDSEYNEYYFGEDKDAFSDVNVSAGLAYQITENLSAGLSLHYAEIVDSDLTDGSSDSIWTVFSVGVSF